MTQSLESIFVYLEKQGWNIEEDNLKLQLFSNPDFPSLKAITDAFDYFDIDNQAAYILKEELLNLPDFFLTNIVIDDQPKIVSATILNHNKIEIQFDKSTRLNYSREDFEKIWEGTVIVIEENTARPSTIQTITQKNELLLFIAACIGCCLYLQDSLLTNLFMFINCVGCYLSYLLINEELGYKNKIVASVCKAINSKNSCADVINSKESKVYKNISLSDLTICFFITISISLLLFGLDLSFFLIISLLLIPIIFYSLYIQSAIIKNWCVLCLFILLLFAINFILTIYNFRTFNFSINYVLKTCIISILVSFVWFAYKKKTLLLKASYKNEIKYSKIAKDITIFKTLLQSNKQIFNKEKGYVSLISFGCQENPKAIITAITNPYCGYCKDAFFNYLKIIENNKFTQLNIIFNTGYNDYKSPQAQVALKVIDLFIQNKNLSLQALSKWFLNPDFEKWKTIYSDFKISESALSILDDHNSFCKTNNIEYTPTTFLDNYEFPQQYDKNDLTYFVNEFIIQKQF